MISIAKFRRPGLRGIFDFESPIQPKLPPMDLPLDAGSLAPGNGGGADDGGEPAPAPPPGVPADFPGVEVPLNVPGYVLPADYAYQVQELPRSEITVTAPAVKTEAGLPTWAIAAGAALAGIAVTALLLRRK